MSSSTTDVPTTFTQPNGAIQRIGSEDTMITRQEQQDDSSWQAKSHKFSKNNYQQYSDSVPNPKLLNQSNTTK